MPRRPARVTQADIARAIRAVADSGRPATIRIDKDGNIDIIDVGKEPSAPSVPVERRPRPVL